MLSKIEIVSSLADTRYYSGICTGCPGRTLTTVEQVQELRQENCSLIEGPLIIQTLSAGNWTRRPSLQSIRQISHFLVIQRLEDNYESLSQLLPNLAAIRGHHLLDNKWALVLEDNHYLREVDLPVLPSVLNGDILLSGNPLLSAANSLDWNSTLLNGIRQSVVTEGWVIRNGTCGSEEGCSHTSAADCPNGAAHMVNRSKTSAELCLTGYVYNEFCAEKCPSHMLVLDGFLCVDKCREVATFEERYLGHYDYFVGVTSRKTFAHEGACLDSCPEEYIANSDTAACEPCGSSCRTACQAPVGVVRNVTNLRALQGCTIITGNLEISIRTRAREMPDLVKYLGSLEKIEGWLIVFGSRDLDTLAFFKNLTVIGHQTGGRLWQDRYVFALFDNPTLSHLWPGAENLTVPDNSSAYIHFNPFLCGSEHEHLKKRFATVDGDVGNSIAGLCDVTWLSLSFVYNSATSLTVHWEPENASNTIPPSANVLSYLIYYISLFDLETYVYYKNVTTEDWYLDWINGGSPNSIDYWSLVRADGMVTSAEISGLTGNTDYMLQVRTNSLSGLRQTGSMSRLYYIRTPQKAPSEPYHVTVTNCCTGDDSTSVLNVHWKEPFSPNGNTLAFFLEATNISWNLCNRDLMNDSVKVPVALRSLPVADAEDGMCLETCWPRNRHPVPYDDDDDGVSDYFYTYFYYYLYSELKKLSVFPIRGERCDDGIGIRTTEKSAIITDLQPFTPYSIRVRAANAAGCGAWSEGVLALTGPSYSGDLVINMTVTHHFDLISINWTRPTRPNGGVVLGYLIELRTETETSLHLKEMCAGRCSCDSLLQQEAGNLFVCQVSVSNVELIAVAFVITQAPDRETVVWISVSALSLFIWPDNLRPTVVWNVTIPPAAFAEDNAGSSEITDDRSIVILSVILGVAMLLLVALAVCFLYLRRRRSSNNPDFQHLGITYDGTELSVLTLDEIYKPDEWEVERTDVTTRDVLGEGAFGIVHAGTLRRGSDSFQVAIKTLSCGSTPLAKMSFLQEASIMKIIDCDLIVRLLGIVSKEDPVLVIMELMAKGDLKNYLRSLRPKEENSRDFPLPGSTVLQMAAQIAAGMAYLAHHKFVHRDLAARNCMVSEDDRVKIGDFGLTRDVYQNDYYRKHGKGPMPVRWMAPESLRDGIFTHLSDVWSYGIVLWEISALGAQPYQGKSNEEVMEFVLGGHVMKLTSLTHAPSIFVRLMQKCWAFSPECRPNFEEILGELPSVEGYEAEI